MNKPEESPKPLEIIKLDYPFIFGKGENSREISELPVLRRLKAKDFKGIQANNMLTDDMLRMICKLTNEPMSLIEELDASDMWKCVEVVNSFLPSSRTTG